MDRKSIWAAALLFVLVVLALHAQSARRVDMVFTTRADVPGRLQIFHDAHGRFVEGSSQWVDLSANVPEQHVLTVAGRGAAQLRLDPPSGVTTMVCGLRIGRSGPREQYELRSSRNVRIASDADCLALKTGPGASDPQVTLAFTGSSRERIRHAGAWQHAFRMSVAAALLVLWWMVRRRRMVAANADARASPRWLSAMDRNAHWLGATLVLLLGSAYIASTPPGAVPDEPAHLAKVIRVAHGIPFAGSGHERLPGLGGIYGPFQNYLGNKAPFSREQLSAQLRKQLQCEGVTTRLPQQANGYSPLPYLLPAVAFKATCAAGGSVGAFLTWARLLNLVLAMALVAFALRYAAMGKWALFAVALLPMSLFQMASLSVDSLSISLGIAWLGLVSGLAGGKLAPDRATPMLWVLSLAIALSKPEAVWILPSLLFCRQAFERARRPIVPALLKFVALPCVIHLAWLLATRDQAVAREDVDAAANAASLLTAPWIFAQAWFETFAGARALQLAKMLIGVLGWLDVYLSPWAYPAAAIALVASLRADPAPGLAPPRWVAPAALTLAIASTVMVALPLFIYWTPTGSGVQGLQGRYFLVALSFVLVWCARPSSARVSAWLVPGIVAVAVAINFDALRAVHEAYFVVGR
jgi:uncharacterized membrane protein